MSESNGVWGQGTEVVLPGGAELASNGDQYASLGSVSCTSAGNCAASGYYTDGSHFYQGMAVTETDGVWGPATEIVLPNNHVGGNPQAEFTSIACWGAGDCSAVGSYTDSGNNSILKVTPTGGISTIGSFRRTSFFAEDFAALPGFPTPLPRRSSMQRS